MNESDFRELCITVLIDYIRRHVDPAEDVAVTKDKIYFVWECKTLQNNKALCSTTLPDGKYYELTYNGDKKELYLDCYDRTENVCVKIGE